ncbi:unnamed protein product [Paramecium primaurelia]|uniref:Transmembrane protein n=1 Tax=Paramecium primaurelia TaxID=5886 RepID=A0A8S1Q7R8_PARPR|nr:unnamed protein product [Paramecium primaurelia]
MQKINLKLYTQLLVKIISIKKDGIFKTAIAQLYSENVVMRLCLEVFQLSLIHQLLTIQVFLLTIRQKFHSNFGKLIVGMKMNMFIFTLMINYKKKHFLRKKIIDFVVLLMLMKLLFLMPNQFIPRKIYLSYQPQIQTRIHKMNHGGQMILQLKYCYAQKDVHIVKMIQCHVTFGFMLNHFGKLQVSSKDGKLMIIKHSLQVYVLVLIQLEDTLTYDQIKQFKIQSLIYLPILIFNQNSNFDCLAIGMMINLFLSLMIRKYQINIQINQPIIQIAEGIINMLASQILELK